jgi:hypothetical protein
MLNIVKKNTIQKTGSALRKEATIKLLKIKLRKFDLELKVLNKKIAKSGLDISDLSDELEEVKREEEEEANRPFQMPSELTSVDVNEKPPANAEEYILNEIELIKFQNQNEIEEIKLDFEKQIEALNNKVIHAHLNILFSLKFKIF